jgi:hypothetical protein
MRWNIQVAEIFTRALGRPIRHIHETATDHAKLYKMISLGDIDTDLLTEYDSNVARGSDEAIYAEKDKILGTKHLEDFVKLHEYLWEKPNKTLT